MIGDSVVLSAVSVLGFVAGLFGLLLVLAWLEHPETPSWLRRRSARRASRHLAGDDEHHPIGHRDRVVGDPLVVPAEQRDVHR